MKTFEILLKCLPGFLSVGGGLYYVLAALFPFWRELGWNNWKIYDTDTNPNSWFVALGFEKAPKVVKEGDFSPRKSNADRSSSNSVWDRGHHLDRPQQLEQLNPKKSPSLII